MLSVIMLSAIMLSVIMLSVIMLSVIMLTVVLSILKYNKYGHAMSGLKKVLFSILIKLGKDQKN